MRSLDEVNSGVGLDEALRHVGAGVHVRVRRSLRVNLKEEGKRQGRWARREKGGEGGRRVKRREKGEEEGEGARGGKRVERREKGEEEGERWRRGR